jgi:putative DNA primase/helicase
MTVDTSEQQRWREEAFQRLMAEREQKECPERRPVIVRLRDVQSEPVRWLWPSWLAYGLLTILGGYGGDGKSTLLMSLVATLSRGGVLPDGKRAPVVNTLILSAEDDAQYAIRPRLEAHHADLDRITLLKGAEGEGGKTKWFNIRKDIDVMREVIEAEDIGLVIIDPLSSYMPKADRNSEGDVRDALMPLQVLMEETRVAVIGVMHVGKADSQRRAAQRLLGSTAFTALARSVWMVHDLPDEHQPDYDPDDLTVGKRKALGIVKSNYSIPPSSLAFSRPLDGALTWHGQSPVSIDECFAEDSKKAAPRTSEAVEWLADFLKGGSKFANEVYTAADQADISEGTLRIAKRKLGIETYKDVGHGGRWLWKLPNSPAKPAEPEADTIATDIDINELWERTA